MPIDNYEEDSGDKKDQESAAGAGRRFKEFDCPGCNANNPAGEPFGDGDELLCNYCGAAYLVKVTEEGRLKLKEN